MKFQLAILCLIAFSTPALAQYGVSNQRDMYGNIVRDAGASSRTGIIQRPVNNGAVRNSPGQPQPTNTGIARGARK